MKTAHRLLLFLLLFAMVSCRYNYPQHSARNSVEYIESLPLPQPPPEGCLVVEVLGISTRAEPQHGVWWLTVDVRVIGRTLDAQRAAAILDGFRAHEIFGIFDRDGALVKSLDPARLDRATGYMRFTPTSEELLPRRDIDDKHAAVLASGRIPLPKAPKPGGYTIYMLTDVIKDRLHLISDCIELPPEPLTFTLYKHESRSY